MKLLKNVTLCFVIPFVLATAAQGADGFTPTGNLGTARSGHTATLLPNGKVLVAGGGTNTAELYNPATGTWSPTGSLGITRSLHTATLLSNGKVLVVGGMQTGNIFLTSAELYDPVTGTWSPTGSLFIDHQAPNYPQRFYRVSAP